VASSDLEGPDLTQMAFDSLAIRLVRLGTATASDVLDEAGFPLQVLSFTTMWVLPGIRFAGPAVCLRGQARIATRTMPPQDPHLSPYALDAAARAGAVMIVATGGFTGGAIVGGAIARGLRRMNCAGLVTDGLVRDSTELLEVGLPIAAAGLTPVNGSRRWSIVDMNSPVVLPGQGGGSVVVNPGDYVLGDADGVVVVPQGVAPDVVAMAEELARKEALITDEIVSGVRREEAFARHDRFAHLRWLRDRGTG
jgi:4-hydroxy-4-methyl-2-oxoglutarate aldolase